MQNPEKGCPNFAKSEASREVEIQGRRNIKSLVWNKTLKWAHTGLISSRSFQNYAFKGGLSLETRKLRLLVLTKTLFLMTLIIKLTLHSVLEQI